VHPRVDARLAFDRRIQRGKQKMVRSKNGTQSKKVATWLRELSELETSAGRLKANPAHSGVAAAERVNSLRELIPTSILLHYDHLKSRGKRSVAPVTRGVCGSCHLAFPSGSLANLRRTSETLNGCVNCGAFVYLAEEEPANGSTKVIPDGRKKIQSKRGVVRRHARIRSRKVRAAA
jgi:predicted  nucleic acid-binding Zn-ribbon protein